jgi:hypothetical protein
MKNMRYIYDACIVVSQGFRFRSAFRSWHMMTYMKMGGALLAAAIVSGQTQSGPSVPPSPAEKPAAVPEGQAGMVVYIDPQTGVIRPDPAPGTVPLQLTPQDANSARTDHEGLVSVPSAVPGGGNKVDLQGRFQSPLIGTIDANGKVTIQHLPVMPTSPDKK